MSSQSGTGSVAELDHLSVGYESAPINVSPTKPRFSWRAEPSGRGARQTAYRILVAKSPDALAERRGPLWDSGRVERPDSTDVPYDGMPLESGTDYYWTVRVWDQNGEPSAWAEPARFSTALVDDAEWEGSWIGHRPEGGDSNGYRSRWHPAGADAEEWVQVDLGERVAIDRIDLHPADPFNGPETPDGLAVSAVYSHEELASERVTVDGPGGFGFPNRYRIDVSADPDFEEFRTVVDRTDEDQENPGVDPVSISVDVDGVRYVRVTATELFEFDPASTPRTGFLGTRPLIHTLVDHGYEDLAYEIVSQPERPSWVYMVRQGATTTWERWDSDDRIGDGMNSFNHSPFNFVSEWFYAALGGLRFDDSMHGLGSVKIAPAIVEDLDWAAVELETVNGPWPRAGRRRTTASRSTWRSLGTRRRPLGSRSSGKPSPLPKVTRSSGNVAPNPTFLEESTR